ncbi:hypothetical protein DPMN_071548 [Dreissena polymorpha]|uniref:Uncharacterized protein n=1 Tax=Dreissena polymorpha TaxID=45954 RepID=A0A9D4BXD4_DREPO|nr:hypothetical protein DPMN_071548 [Dreissena polymorpha]
MCHDTITQDTPEVVENKRAQHYCPIREFLQLNGMRPVITAVSSIGGTRCCN